MTVEFRCASARGRRYARAVRVDAERLLDSTRLGHAELSITLTGDRAIRQLNREFRGIDSPTDVLSFAQIESRGVRVIGANDKNLRRGAPLGDIVISVDSALRDSRNYEIAPRAYLRRLLIHGLLHLLGYDHERSARDAHRMFARQRRLEVRLRESRAGKSR